VSIERLPSVLRDFASGNPTVVLGGGSEYNGKESLAAPPVDSSTIAT